VSKKILPSKGPSSSKAPSSDKLPNPFVLPHSAIDFGKLPSAPSTGLANALERLNLNTSKVGPDQSVLRALGGLNTASLLGLRYYSLLTTGRAAYGFTGMLHAAFTRGLERLVEFLAAEEEKKQSVLAHFFQKIHEFFERWSAEIAQRHDDMAFLLALEEEEWQKEFEEFTRNHPEIHDELLKLGVKYSALDLACNDPDVLAMLALHVDHIKLSAQLVEKMSGVLNGFGLSDEAHKQTLDTVHRVVAEHMFAAFAPSYQPHENHQKHEEVVGLHHDTHNHMLEVIAQEAQHHHLPQTPLHTTPAPSARLLTEAELRLQRSMMREILSALFQTTLMSISHQFTQPHSDHPEYAGHHASRRGLFHVLAAHTREVVHATRDLRALHEMRPHHLGPFPGQQRYQEEQRRTAEENAAWRANCRTPFDEAARRQKTPELKRPADPY
jgi:hypothetical protein